MLGNNTEGHVALGQLPNEATSGISFDWFKELSKPQTLQKQGLLSDHQQSFASPARLLPTPSVFASLKTTETKNGLFFIEAMRPFFNQPISANVSIAEIDVLNASVGFIDQSGV